MKKLNPKLRTFLTKAYAPPYSNFFVAPILVSKNKIISQGVNMKNVTYPTSICAKRNAIWSSITNNINTMQISKVYIMTKVEKKCIFPCEACCQVMSEQLSLSVNIILYKYNEKSKTFRLNDLLPYMINNDDLFGKN